jgi:hypothetical protein
LNLPPLHIGIDFDNTLVSYDDLFYRCALERKLIPPALAPTKSAVRAYLWAQPDGNTPWTELQGEVYGRRMDEAVPFPGALEFLSFCREHGFRVSIISHKAEYPALGPRTNLRTASLRWMTARRFFNAHAGGLKRADVFFESSRENKIGRIGSKKCTHFIDDLPELLTDPAFPPSTQRLLFDHYNEKPELAQILVFPSWQEILRYFAELTNEFTKSR